MIEVLKAHDWPGNIRELQNFIERAVVFSPESVLRLPLADLKLMTKQPSPAASRTLADAEREHILDVLKQTDGLIGGQCGAASRLGLPRTTLVYKMRKLGIEAAPVASGSPRSVGWRWACDGTGWCRREFLRDYALISCGAIPRKFRYWLIGPLLPRGL